MLLSVDQVEAARTHHDGGKNGVQNLVASGVVTDGGGVVPLEETQKNAPKAKKNRVVTVVSFAVSDQWLGRKG